MNLLNLTYYQSSLNATIDGTFVAPFTGKAPRKGMRIPLNKIKYNEQRDEGKGRSGRPFASERAGEARSGIPFFSDFSYTYFGARYMDHELMTMWLSVDPMSDKYPNVYPDTFRHMSGHWNVYREGKKLDELPNYTRLNSLVRVVKMKEAFVYRLLIP